MANGVSAAHIDAHTSSEERERILNAHAEGDIRVLSNVGITTKGWDSPDTTCLIYARPTKSLMLHIQILGRVLRKSSCGTPALILDHGNNSRNIYAAASVRRSKRNSKRRLRRRSLCLQRVSHAITYRYTSSVQNVDTSQQKCQMLKLSM